MVASELRDKLKGHMNPTAPASAADSPVSTPSPRPPASPRPTPSPSPNITAGVAQTPSFSPRVGNGSGSVGGSGSGIDNGSNNATATAAVSATTPASVTAAATAIATAAPEDTAIEQKGGRSDFVCSKADRPAEEEGKRSRDPRDPPPIERIAKKRKAGEGEGGGMEGLEGEGQTTAITPKRPRSL